MTATDEKPKTDATDEAANELAAATADLLRAITNEWQTGQQIDAAIPSRDDAPPKGAYIRALYAMIGSGQVQRWQSDSGWHYRLRRDPGAVKRGDALGGIPDAMGGTRADIEKILARYEQITGNPIARTYCKGREDDWDTEQLAAGMHPLGDVPLTQWGRLKDAALLWLKANGKGRSYRAVLLRAAHIWRAEVAEMAEGSQVAA